MPHNEARYQRTRTRYREAILAVEANIRQVLLAEGHGDAGVAQVLDSFYQAITDTSGTVWALLADAEHPSEAMPLPVMCLALWALRTGHAGLAGPGVWHDYPRMPTQAEMETTVRRLQALEETRR
jgi:hypothetical protein